jgi:adenosylcobinamide-phosphate synthase
MFIIVPIVVGCILDFIFGDPKWLPHPIRFIGFLIKNGEKWLRKLGRSHRWEYIGGAILSILVISIVTFLSLIILIWLYKINLFLAMAVHSLMCYQIIAAKCLRDEGIIIFNELKKGDLGGAQQKLSLIVSRDTASLDESRIVKSTVETISENTSDGVVAPLIFMLIGGAPLGFLYKTINTLDSMIGYKNERYIRFGRFAAKLDDIFNYVPARISAWMMILASRICGYDWRKAIIIFRRDRSNHPSPNSAQTESVCAGALGIQIAGANYYFGKLIEKPTIGDDLRPAVKEDILKANRLMYGSFLLTLLAGIIVWSAVLAFLSWG